MRWSELCLEEKYKATSVAGMDMTEERRHLELCMDYIERHFEDQEEHAKIYSKCAWLLAGIHYLSKNYMETIRYCERGIDGIGGEITITLFYAAIV